MKYVLVIGMILTMSTSPLVGSLDNAISNLEAEKGKIRNAMGTLKTKLEEYKMLTHNQLGGINASLKTLKDRQLPDAKTQVISSRKDLVPLKGEVAQKRKGVQETEMSVVRKESIIPSSIKTPLKKSLNGATTLLSNFDAILDQGDSILSDVLVDLPKTSDALASLIASLDTLTISVTQLLGDYQVALNVITTTMVDALHTAQAPLGSIRDSMRAIEESPQTIATVAQTLATKLKT